MSDSNSLRRQAVRFLVVGGLNTLATYAVFIVLGLFMPAWIAYTIAFAAGIAWVVLGSSKFVYKGDHSARRLAVFAGWYIVIYAIGRVIIHLLSPVGFVDLAIASVLVLVVTTPLNFIGGRFIFAPRTPPVADAAG
jgi:putative flippase GtrA